MPDRRADGARTALSQKNSADSDVAARQPLAASLGRNPGHRIFAEDSQTNTGSLRVKREFLVFPADRKKATRMGRGSMPYVQNALRQRRTVHFRPINSM